MRVKLIEAWIDQNQYSCITVKKELAYEESIIQLIKDKISSADYMIALALPRRTQTADKSSFTAELSSSSSPWVHMEVAMAFQLGKPICLIKDSNLPKEGIFDNRVSRFDFLEINSKTKPESIRSYLNDWQKNLNHDRSGNHLIAV